jgi:hypothetical protein
MNEHRHAEEEPDNPPVDGPGSGQGTKDEDTEQQGSSSYDSPEEDGGGKESASKRHEDSS